MTSFFARTKQFRMTWPFNRSARMLNRFGDSEKSNASRYIVLLHSMCSTYPASSFFTILFSVMLLHAMVTLTKKNCLSELTSHVA